MPILIFGERNEQNQAGQRKVFTRSKLTAGFEHTEQETIIDPLAGVLEVMSNIEPYELMASQIVIKPVQDDWKESAIPIKIVQKLKGVPEKPASLKAYLKFCF
jgi:hypothetical protein